jgi:flagellar biosynthesis/type III secretory pathway protein FliH
MARVTRARIVSKATATSLPISKAPSSRTVEKLARAELDAKETAARTLAEAKRAADAIVAEARAKAQSVAQNAAREAAEAEQAKVAALYTALRAREERSAEEQIDKSVELARVLAERLLGESLQVDPLTVAKLARQALAEAQGARTVRIEAHPDDIATLKEHVTMLNIGQVASISPDATLERGSLRLHTDLGTIDAQLRPQLERLAAALRDALRG